MTLDVIAQVGIVVCGCASVWLVSRRESWRRWGYIFGLLGQPFWMYTTVHHEQWGIAAITLFYTYSWAQGIWNYWLFPGARGNPDAPPAGHIIDDRGVTRRVLGKIPLTADGCVYGVDPPPCWYIENGMVVPAEMEPDDPDEDLVDAWEIYSTQGAAQAALADELLKE